MFYSTKVVHSVLGKVTTHLVKHVVSVEHVFPLFLNRSFPSLLLSLCFVDLLLHSAYHDGPRGS